MHCSIPCARCCAQVLLDDEACKTRGEEPADKVPIVGFSYGSDASDDSEDSDPISARSMNVRKRTLFTLELEDKITPPGTKVTKSEDEPDSQRTESPVELVKCGLLKVVYPTPEFPDRCAIVDVDLKFMKGQKYKDEDRARVDAMVRSCKDMFLKSGLILTPAKRQMLRDHITEMEQDIIYWSSDSCSTYDINEIYQSPSDHADSEFIAIINLNDEI